MARVEHDNRGAENRLCQPPETPLLDVLQTLQQKGRHCCVAEALKLELLQQQAVQAQRIPTEMR